MSTQESAQSAEAPRPRPTPIGTLRFSESATGVVAVAGELDVATAPLLEEYLAEREGPIRLDMGAVTFIDSSGIRALLHLYRHCEGNGCTFLLQACSPPVQQVLRITGLYDLLTEDGDGHH